MSQLKVSVVPVGKIDPVEIEACLSRVVKILTKPVELRAPAPVPRSSEDATRGQHRSAAFLSELRAAFPRLAVAKLVGAPGPSSPIPADSYDAIVFVTDADLFRPDTDAVFGEIDPKARAAVLSVRRLREAFYRRKADPARQRTRVVKGVVQAIGRIHGLPDCRDPRCVMACVGALGDLDLKGEKFCGSCWKRLTTGTFRI
jgi:predicted Zn-dependent protease